MENKKKAAAAISAVMQYLRTEEELICMQAMQAPAAAEAPAPAPPPAAMNLWGVSGRQSQMQMRNLMQLKAFHGFKLR